MKKNTKKWKKNQSVLVFILIYHTFKFYEYVQFMKSTFSERIQMFQLSASKGKIQALKTVNYNYRRNVLCLFWRVIFSFQIHVHIRIWMQLMLLLWQLICWFVWLCVTIHNAFILSTRSFFSFTHYFRSI